MVTFIMTEGHTYHPFDFFFQKYISTFLKDNFVKFKGLVLVIHGVGKNRSNAILACAYMFSSRLLKYYHTYHMFSSLLSSVKTNQTTLCFLI